jgi:hypothetical protein
MGFKQRNYFYGPDSTMEYNGKLEKILITKDFIQFNGVKYPRTCIPETYSGRMIDDHYNITINNKQVPLHEILENFSN